MIQMLPNPNEIYDAQLENLEGMYTAYDLAEDIVGIIEKIAAEAAKYGVSADSYSNLRYAILAHLRQCEFIK
jgi:hypothetical protein